MKSNIKWLIAKSPYNQQQIAEMLDMSYQQLNMWANGKKYPRIDKAQKLADILGCTLNDLYEKDG